MGPPGAREWEAEGSTWAALEAAGNGVQLNTLTLLSSPSSTSLVSSRPLVNKFPEAWAMALSL